MGRLHLIELHEQRWMPALLRDAATGYLEALARVMRVDEHLAPLVRDALARSGESAIVDLCSGSGGPIVNVRERLDPRPELTLTDKFPSPTVFESAKARGVHVRLDSIDATNVPGELRGLRTIVNALHHFRPDAARAILADAVRRRVPLLAIELSERSAATVLSAPMIMLFTLLLVPAVRPWRWAYAFFTYVIPILPLIVFWDGLVSHLRTYSIAELEALTHGLDDGGYAWEALRVPIAPGANVTVLLGMPPRA